MSFVFEGISYSIEGKAILNNVSAHVQAGELVALMGPSGAGKTTLLRTLAHRVKPDTGSILINQQRLTRRLARRISYVLQENVFFENSTLKETIEFSAKLRLPDSMTMAEKLRKVDQVVNLLKLDKCLNTVIGGSFKHGLSGGEKKRASIACELLTDPILLLLDEPTSGLDSTNALNLMKTLKELVSTENRMAIVSIHQPSSKLFYMFNKLILLGEGNVAYFGRPTEVIKFFSNCGFHCVDHYNPADFILEKACEGGDDFDRIVRHYNEYKDKAIVNFGDTDHAVAPMNLMWRDMKKETILSSELIDGKQQTQIVFTSNGTAKSAIPEKITHQKEYICKRNSLTNGTDYDINNVDPEATFGVPNSDFKQTTSHLWPTTFSTQYKVISRRAFTQTKRHLMTKLKAIQLSLMMMIIGVTWFQVPHTEKWIQAILGYLFIISVFWSFTPMFDACTFFPLERTVFIKERSAGMFRISSYYLAKATSEIPVNFLWPTAFFTVSYWCSGIGGFTLYLSLLGVLLTTVVTSQALGLLISVTVKDFQKVFIVASVTMLSFMMLAGYYNQYLPSWLTWCRYLSFITYSYTAMVILTFQQSAPFHCAAVSAFEVCQRLNITDSLHMNATRTDLITGDMVLDTVEVLLPLWGHIVLLFAIGVAFRSFAYLGLRYLNRPQ